MEQRPPKPMTLFDSIITPPRLYALKLMLPYTPASMQQFLAFYIKFLELRHTMEDFRGFPPTSANKILDDLKPYMSPEDMERMEQMEGMMNMMEMIQGMQSMQEAANGSAAGINPMEMLKGMMNPEQQDMFQMYSDMFDNELSSPGNENEKGESEHE